MRSFFSLSEVKVTLISLAHAINDMYAGFLPAFMPHIKATLGLSYALAGNLSVIVGISHIICQPLVGYVCDRMRRPYLMMIGPLLCGLGAVMFPNSTSYAAALFFSGVWGLGSALFHPQGSGGVGYVSKPEKLSKSLTWFNVAGTFGVLISPVIAVTTVKFLGYRWLPLTILPTLLLAPLLYLSIPSLTGSQADSQDRARQGLFKTMATVFAVLYPVWGISVVRDIVFQGVRYFLPMKIAAEGGSLDIIGTVLFFLTLGGTLTMIPIEMLARRAGSKRVLMLSLFLGAVFLIVAAFTTSMTSIVLYIIGVSCIYSTLPITLLIAQNLMPFERSIASSLVMGLAWGVANMSLLPIGSIADHVGVHNMFIFIGFLPLLGLFFFLCPVLRKIK